MPQRYKMPAMDHAVRGHGVQINDTGEMLAAPTALPMLLGNCLVGCALGFGIGYAVRERVSHREQLNLIRRYALLLRPSRKSASKTRRMRPIIAINPRSTAEAGRRFLNKAKSLTKLRSPGSKSRSTQVHPNDRPDNCAPVQIFRVI
jgi:hypothetical protein